MKVRTKTLAILIVSIILTTSIISFLSSLLVLDAYTKLEGETVQLSINQFHGALLNDIRTLDSITQDWAFWDDTYNFVQYPNEEYLNSNTIDDTFKNLQINYMIFLNNTDQIVFSKGVDLEENQEISLPSNIQDLLLPSSPLLQYPNITSSCMGIAQTPEGPLLVASRPVLPSDKNSPIQGTLIMARFLNAAEIQRLRSIVQHPLSIYPINDPEITHLLGTDTGHLDITQNRIYPVDTNSIAGFITIPDIYGNPAYILRTDLTRDIYLQGKTNVFYLIIVIFSTGLIFCLVSIGTLERLVLTRLGNLNAAVSDIGSKGDPSRRITLPGNDEFSFLAETINTMMDDLQLVQTQLLDSEKRYHAVVEDQTELITRFRPDRTHVFVNEAYCKYFCKSKEEILNNQYSPQILDEDQKVVRDHFASLSPVTPVKTIEYRIQMPDGEIRWNQWTDRAIYSDDGSLVEYQSVGRDISNLKKVEEAYRIAYEKLNILTSLTRHDILNILMGIKGYVTMASEETTDERIRKDLTKASELTELLEKFLQFTRDYQDLGVRSPQWQSVEEKVRQVVRGMKVSPFTLDMRVRGLTIYADPLLEKVFYNLLENALRHGKHVSNIEVWYHLEDKGLVLVLQDNGIGIPSKEKELIFKKGYGKNTGLGLFFIRQILGITGLTIRECGEQGKGAQFEIFIPRGHFQISVGKEMPEPVHSGVAE